MQINITVQTFKTENELEYSLIRWNKVKNEFIFTGGGRKNKYILKSLSNLRKDIKFSIIDDYKFNGDLVEAQMFAYIGVRSIKKLILSSQSTTGVKKSISGGKLYKFND